MATRQYIQAPAGLSTFLKALEREILLEPGYLTDGDCPYDPEVRRILGSVGRLGGVDRIPAENLFEGKDEFEVILKEIEATISEMKNLEMDVTEPGDRIQLVKAKTQLLERWSSQKERIWNLKAMAEFVGIVIDYMDVVLADHKDLRTEFIRRIRECKLGQAID